MLSPLQELMFLKWYGDIAGKLGLNPDPDSKEHYYDYRGAWMSGPKSWPTESGGHWPSNFKDDDHPNRFIPLGGAIYDTKHERFVSPYDPANEEMSVRIR